MCESQHVAPVDYVGVFIKLQAEQAGRFPDIFDNLRYGMV